VINRVPMRLHPHLLEVNARVLIERLSQKHGQRLTLGTVPEEEWRGVARQGFDLLWLMGVWQRSPGARQEALAHQDLRRSYGDALPDWKDEDVAGSPYAIYTYALDPALGGEGDLAELRSKLRRLGLRLILDFVPNHVALDHPWVTAHPDRFVCGSEEDARMHPDWFYSPYPSVHVAHGKDPNFPPWTDTAQVNFFSREMRHALVDVLMRVAHVADGIRCDMAMLALNDVFRGVWGWVVKDAAQPSEEFWTEAIQRVRQADPEFLFLAEAYWGLESQLINLGFDYTYDKTLYDRLRDSNAADVRQYLGGGGHLLDRQARFIENHDELRAPAAFGRARARAAAVVFATLPGLRLFHDGQLTGRRIRLPIQLIREPSEPSDAETAEFYDRLLSACGVALFHEGEWRLLEAAPAWDGNESHQSLLAWSWQRSGELGIVVVNYSPSPAQGRIEITLPDDRTQQVSLRDELTGEIRLLGGRESSRQTLYAELGPWCSHIFVNVAPT